MTETINLSIDQDIIKFKSLNNINIYGIYYPAKTTLNKVISTFYENYNWTNMCDLRLDIYSPEFKKYITEFDCNKTMKDLGFKSSELHLKLLDKELIISQDIDKYTNDIIKGISESKDKFNIKIKTMMHKIIILDVIPSTTINELKYMIQKEGIDYDLQRIIFNGKQLNDNDTFSDHNIIQGNELYLILRLRGGMFHETSGRNGNYQPLKTIIFNIDPDK